MMGAAVTGGDDSSCGVEELHRVEPHEQLALVERIRHGVVLTSSLQVRKGGVLETSFTHRSSDMCVTSAGGARLQHVRARRDDTPSPRVMPTRGRAHAALFTVRTRKPSTDPWETGRFKHSARMQGLHMSILSFSVRVRRCTLPPAENFHLWELVGTPGKRNGGKLLREKMIALQNWWDGETRHITVRRESFPRSAPILWRSFHADDSFRRSRRVSPPTWGTSGSPQLSSTRRAAV